MRFMLDNDDDFQDIGRSERENVEKATIKNVCYVQHILLLLQVIFMRVKADKSQNRVENF